MFAGNNARDKRTVVSPASGGRGTFSVLGADVVVTGSVRASADLHIQGRIEGDVIGGTVIQGAESHITGTLTAEVARLAGAVEGVVRVRTLTIEPGARITGDVEYETITIENGGSVDGRLKHVDALDASAPATAIATVSLAASNERAA
ncbi:MAG: polymer-forming cytoskeletal protein [Sphingomonas sp.]|uniref:bactofilin family protein n=1 Tax=Sphingomonas sp. TaxID=28214 RepID=UPI001B1AA3D2|nr:polymer-forming cytoskeletal protein [Sphingomonas sp.]MBO9621112.1 polymer-forming cytoskeletal protein [Sphingomonas sp.]